MSKTIQLCSVCERPATSSESLPAGALVSSPLYPHERYKVVLCDACFSTCFAYLRSERRIHIMFHEFEDNAYDFGRVSARDLSQENEAALEALMDALARDIEAHPKRLIPLASELVARLNALIDKCDVDLNTPLPPDH